MNLLNKRGWISELILFSFFSFSLFAEEKIDRKSLVERHNIISDSAGTTVPLANGEFCFNTDGTGLQTFAGSIFDHRAWFALPLPEGRTIDDVPATGTFQKGRCIGADPFPEDKGDLFEWMTDSEHRMNLGRVRFTQSDGSSIPADAVSFVQRSLDLWTGIHRTEWKYKGESVLVETAVSNESAVAFRVTSQAIKSGELTVTIDFPYPTSDDKNNNWAGRFDQDQLHQTEILKESAYSMTIARKFGKNAFADFDYSVSIACSKESASLRKNGPNSILITSSFDTLEVLVAFGNFSSSGVRDISQSEKDTLFRNFVSTVSDSVSNFYEAAAQESAERWESYWQSGGAIDLSESSDPRWFELERRIVLSQYLMKMSSAGSYPPPESGLLSIDQWRGRFHCEMLWWHLAHWFLWGRESEADKPLRCYFLFKEQARELAEQLGYRGYKWQKALGPEGRTAPWLGNQVLLWKEPHPIFFAELEYRARPTKETLQKWADLVDGTACNMADYATRSNDGVYHLNPVMPPSELGIVSDTTFDLAYWQLGLNWANRWRQRLGLLPVNEWVEIAENMAPFPVREDGLYLRSAEWPDWKKWEHPDLIGAFGNFPPIKGIDPERARATITEVIKQWDWSACWGWDFPWTAMAAARTGQPDLAIDILLNDSPRNEYDQRGVNLGGPCPYLPGNGGLLYAVAMMAAGWDENSEGNIPSRRNGVQRTAPGFPKNGWKVRWENLLPAP